MEQLNEPLKDGDRRKPARRRILEKAFNNLKSLFDQSAWLLIVLPLTVLFYTGEGAMIKTMMQWTLIAAAIMGFTIIVARIAFPDIHIPDLIKQAELGNTASAVVVAAVLIMVAVIFFAMALWSKT